MTDVKQPVPVAWMPIESAPKDGSEFLGYHLSTDGYTGDWYALVDYSGDPEWPWHDGEGKHHEAFLTHWMPLPAAPADTTTTSAVGELVEALRAFVDCARYTPHMNGVRSFAGWRQGALREAEARALELIAKHGGAK